MTSQTRIDVHREAMRMNIHDLVRRLVDNVGPAVVQGMTGTKDRAMPSRWAKPDGPTPQTTTAQRLRLGFQVWRTVEISEGRDVALAFLLGANPVLGDDLPLNAIHDLRHAEVLGAAGSFVGDVYSG
jgi:hypothetical protein